MKIIIINTLYYPNFVGGAEISVQFLAESLIEAGHEVVILTTVADAGRKIDYVNGVKVYYIGIKNLYWQYHKNQSNDHPALMKSIWHGIDSYNPWMASQISDILDIEKPDLVHTNNLAGFSVSVWKTIKKHNLPIVHTIRDYYLICPRKYIMFRNGQSCEAPCWDCNIYSLPRNKSSNLVDAVVGVSKHILDNHLKLNYFSHVPIQTVIYNSYQAASIDIKQEGKCLRLGYLGRLEQIKGFELLLDCLAEIPTDKVELLVGGSVTQEEINHFQSRYPYKNVSYLGFVKPKDLFSKIDVLIVPSLWQEPLGRTVLEAYAHGVSVIGSNRGGIPEMIDCGKTGFLFEPSLQESLVAAINVFIENPALATQMGKNAYLKAQEFTLRKIMQDYLNIYKIFCK